MTETCSAVLRSRRNCSNDGAERTDDGRAFNYVELSVQRNLQNLALLRVQSGRSVLHDVLSVAACIQHAA